MMPERVLGREIKALATIGSVQRRRALLAAWLCTVHLLACGAESTPLDEARRRAVYDANDRPFARAGLWKPAAFAGTAFTLAPLLVLEAGVEGQGVRPFEVYFQESSVEILGRSYPRWTYLWNDGGMQGLRVTLGADGFPAIYEVLRDSSGARLIFVSTSLEQAASEAFGPPAAGRRFAVERPPAETPGVIVPGILEPGPTPLGPFVYLAAGSRDVTSLSCRCMPSLVESIDGSAEYLLVPLDTADPRAPRWPAELERQSPERALRLPPVPLPGAE